MTADLLGSLEASQKKLLATLCDLPAEDCYKQYHPDLSPLAWHLGHCAFIEAYWIREVVLGNNTLTEPIKSLYFPWLSPKTERARRMPGYLEQLKFSRTLFDEHLEILQRLTDREKDHKLLNNNYLLHFLLQHNYQHLETMEQVLHQRAYQLKWEYSVSGTIEPDSYCVSSYLFVADEMEFGSGQPQLAFDNERPIYSARLEAFALGQRAVSNAEYLGFMKSGGYTERHYWSETGWQQLQTCQLSAPESWRQDDQGNWYCLTAAGPSELQPQDSVDGINLFEAQAFAKYAGGRLPHEHEWEYATSHHDQQTSQAWVWCCNAFFPYPGFEPYPYDGYSLHWFDGKHHTLRGGSRHTAVPIRRPSFRNFYTPEKRHVFAGVRVAFDL
ncbi:MAG: SUMF1/EgtB/PvdO family nonheme iron enzyme [Acidiferrobacterales bacterium]